SGGIGTPIFGYSNNFALGTLEIGGLNTTSTLSLLDTFGTLDTNDDRKAALYVDSLILNPGSLLIISNNVELYFKNTGSFYNVQVGGITNEGVLILGNGSFHQLVVPEPSIFMLLVLGAAGIFWRRRARR